jgi:hypothetical protein
VRYAAGAVRSVRSGALSRFLIYRSPEFWAPRGELFAFNILMGFAPVLAAVAGCSAVGVAAVRRVVDPRDPLHQLAAPAADDEAQRGVIRAGGRLRDGRVCVIVHEHSRDRAWHEDWRDVEGSPEIETTDGARLTVTWENATFEPALALHASDRESALRSLHRMSGVHPIPEGGRVRELCLPEGQPVFVDGCDTRAPIDVALSIASGAAEPPLVGDCPKPGRPLVITAGDGTARPRIAMRAASLAARVSLLGVPVLLLALYAWRLAGARPIADALVKRLRRPQLPLVEPVALFLTPIIVPLVLLIALFARPSLAGNAVAPPDRYGYAAVVLVVLLLLAAVARMLDRVRALGAAAASVRDAADRRLDRAREGEAMIFDAEVDPAAPTSPGALTRGAHAHWVVAVTRVFQAGRNSASEPGPRHDGPMLVPVRNAGGAAFLDLTHATVDLRARLLRRRGARLRGEAARLAGKIDPASVYLFEERFLDPGEPVHVEGRVLRFAAGPSGAPIPVIGGTPGDPAVVHAGSRTSLLHGLRVERAVLVAAAPILGVTVLALSAIASYLVTR